MTRVRQWLGLPLFTWLSVTLVTGCSDDKKTTQPPPVSGTSVTELVPARTVAGDTVVVNGQEFGTTQGSSQVLFTSQGGTVAATVVSSGWTDTAIQVLVPSDAATGPVLVTKNGVNSTGKTFTLATRIVSYTNDLLPLFLLHGCESCHGGQNNLFVEPRTALLTGDSDHGPVVIRRRSAQSIIVQKVSPGPPFGDRMPQGSPPLTSAEILLIADWIDQGTRDN